MRLNDVYSYVVGHLRSGDCEISSHGEINIRCPGCGDESHFNVNSKSGLFNCFKCPISGNLQSEISKHLGEWKKLTREISNHPSVIYSCAFPLSTLCENTIYGVMEGIVPGAKQSLMQKQAYQAMMYCTGRGMTTTQIRQYGVFIKPYDPRVYFPYWNESGKIVFTMGRAMNDEIEPKTLEEGDSIKPLFGRHMQVYRNDIILVEGVFDHFVTAGSYALMGSVVTNQQVDQLTQDGIKRVFLMLDPDAGEEIKRAKIKLARRHLDVYPIILGGKRDPAKLGRQVMMNITNIVTHHCPMRPQPLYFNP